MNVSGSTQPRRTICSLQRVAQSPWIRVSSRSKIARAISTALSSNALRTSGYLTQGTRIDRQRQTPAFGVQVGGRAVEHVYHQFHAPGLDPVTNHVAQQTVTADQRVQFTLGTQFDGFRANGDAAVDRPLQQAAGGVGVEQVVVADKTGGKHVHRRGVEGFRVSALDDLALVHQEDPVTHGQGFFLVVGDENGGQAQFALDRPDLLAQVFANPRIEGRQRLIEQQQAWTGDQGAGQGHALALAAGQLVRVARGEVVQFHQLEGFHDALVAVVGIDLLHLQAEGDVLFHGHVGEQRVALEHHADRAFLRAQRDDVLVVEEYLAAVHRGQAGDAAQQGGLAATGRAEQGDEFTLGDFAVDVAEHRGAGVGFFQVLDTDEAHWLLSLFRRLATQVSTSTKRK